MKEPFQFMVTLLRAEPSGPFRILGSDTDYPTLAQARAQAETGGDIEWRASTEPLAGEQACFLCHCTMGKLPEARERHPERICQVCALGAVDANGRRVCFGNTDLSGGFRSWYADTGAPYGGHDCFIRGVACHAREARFGGIVIEPRKQC